MVNVGVIGLGVMGSTHLDAYASVADAKVVAVADTDPEKLTGHGAAGGNIEGQGQGGFDPSAVNTYADGMELIRDPSVELVDICLATPLHARFAVAALQAGKHVLIEKPLARTSEQARQILDAAQKSKGQAMCAQCMRFWPGWVWLKQAVESEAYGPVRSAVFRRVGEHPGGPFYLSGENSGGAILDLHLHDTDFVQHLFGVPEAVTSTGYAKITSHIDHLTTFYHYPGGPHIVAEGGWAMAKGFGFEMTYCVNFEHATAVFDFSKKDAPLTLFERGKEPEAVELEPGMGYVPQLAYFIDCIQAGQAPRRVTLRDAVQSLLIIEAEEQSAKTGRRQNVQALA
jgi:predicted dehydrogenase